MHGRKTGILFLLVGSALLWACGDGSSGTPQGPTAALGVREAGNLPGMLAIDPTRSDPGENRSFARFLIEVLDGSGEQRREIVIEDDFDQRIPHVLPEPPDAIAQHMRDHSERKNIRGSYRIALTVETEEGLRDRAEAVVNLDRDIHVSRLTHLAPSLAAASSAETASAGPGHRSSSDDDSDCPALTCSYESASTSENGHGYQSCVADSSCDTLYPSIVVTALQELGLNVTDKTPLAISAYGAAGADGCDAGVNGGNGGKGGFAQMFTTVADLDSQYGDSLYYFLGEKGGCRDFNFLEDHSAGGGDGGSATIVSWTQTGSDDGEFALGDVFLVAGGGGGGSSGSVTEANGGTSGGHGGYDLYTAQSDYSYSDGDDAADIDSRDCDFSHGGEATPSIIGGYGGYGAKEDGNPGWLASTPPVGSNGHGEDASYDEDETGTGNPGGGGGGAGPGQKGGAGLDSIDDEAFCGGGGGASLAAPSTYFDLEFDPAGRTSHDSDGALYLYFFES